MLKGKILVTGGSGFLGRGIIRRAERESWPCEITILSRDEAKHIKVRARYPHVRIIRGDVTASPEWLALLFQGQDTIIHAAANKLVDIGEAHAFEVVENNVVGSRNVAKAAILAGVKNVVGISSDKAVSPVNVYGMSKAVMERLFQEADTLSDTKFVCARYGNVVGSTISIVLYFQDQLKASGHIRVTNPAMSRFYMSVDEAIDAIIVALDAARGSVVIPKMQAMTVANVARLVLRLPRDSDICEDERVQIVGERPGEKLHESLLHAQESVRVLQTDDELTHYFELLPATAEWQRKTPFTITSDHPPLGPMSFDRMQELIFDSRDV